MAKQSPKPVEHIKDLVQDPNNARVHGERNIGMLVSSLHKVGAARSIVIDEDNVILAGNGTVDAAATAGITRVQVVEADGNTIVAVRRTGLTDEQKIQLAIYDNRTNELSGWDQGALKNLSEVGLNLNEWWFKDELPSELAAESPEQPSTGKSSEPKTDSKLKVSLEFDPDEFMAFKEMTDKLSKKFETTAVQDTIIASLRELTRMGPEK